MGQPERPAAGLPGSASGHTESPVPQRLLPRCDGAVVSAHACALPRVTSPPVPCRPGPATDGHHLPLRSAEPLVSGRWRRTAGARVHQRGREVRVRGGSGAGSRAPRMSEGSAPGGSVSATPRPRAQRPGARRGRPAVPCPSAVSFRRHLAGPREDAPPPTPGFTQCPDPRPTPAAPAPSASSVSLSLASPRLSNFLCVQFSLQTRQVVGDGDRRLLLTLIPGWDKGQSSPGGAQPTGRPGRGGGGSRSSSLGRALRCGHLLLATRAALSVIYSSV